MMRAQRNHLAGLAAEEAVLRDYTREGCQVLARRWRGAGGELDLVLRTKEEIVFVEVKASRSFENAAQRVAPRQIARLFQAAAEYLAHCQLGQLTPSRFDVALVDATGQVRRVPNALI